MSDIQEPGFLSSGNAVADQCGLYAAAMPPGHRSPNLQEPSPTRQVWNDLAVAHASLGGGAFCRWNVDSPKAFQSFSVRAPARVTPNGSSAAPEPFVDPAHMAQTVQEFREELRRLSGRMVSIQEDERRRIALDLHDGLGQSMSLIKLSLEGAIAQLAQGATGEAGQSLQGLVVRVTDALNQVRRVSTELRPSILDDLGILPTLSWHFREFEAVCGGIRVDKAFHIAEEDIPVALHITLYRILQEALHNVVKHARADCVRVVLYRSNDTLHLQVDDNGCGFIPDCFCRADGRIRGFGLSGMKERVLYSGGSWQLRSSPGEGTSIVVTWPCASMQQ